MLGRTMAARMIRMAIATTQSIILILDKNLRIAFPQYHSEEHIGFHTSRLGLPTRCSSKLLEALNLLNWRPVPSLLAGLEVTKIVTRTVTNH